MENVSSFCPESKTKSVIHKASSSSTIFNRRSQNGRILSFIIPAQPHLEHLQNPGLKSETSLHELTQHLENCCALSSSSLTKRLRSLPVRLFFIWKKKNPFN